MHGAGMSNSDTHFHHDLPILIAGGSATGIKTGRHLALPAETPLANLHLTLIDKMGVPVEKFGDASGKIDLLAV
jgi:hypothetical protein